MREGRIESGHSIKSLEGMGSSSHDLGAELRMHSFTVNCDTFSNEEKVAAVVPVTSVEVACSEAIVLFLSIYMKQGLVHYSTTGFIFLITYGAPLWHALNVECILLHIICHVIVSEGFLFNAMGFWKK